MIGKYQNSASVTKINQGLQIPIAQRYMEKVEGSFFYITNEFLRPNSKTKFYVINPTDSVKCTAEDILMTRTGNTGEVVTGVDGVFHNNFFKIKFDKKSLYKDYLYYFLVSPHTQFAILKLAGTSTIPDLNHSDFYRIPITIPPLAEQRTIAKVLSTWDKAIENLTQLITEKQQKKKALMQQLLTGKKRFPGFDGEWKEVQLKDLFKRITRKNTEKNTNVVTISAQRGLVLQDTYFKKNIASEITDNYFLLQKDEFAYNKSYSNGYPMGAIKRLKVLDKAVVTTLYICFDVIDPTQTSRDFFEHFFEEGHLNRGLKKVANEGGRAHGLLNVTPKDFFNLQMKVPEYEEQQKIAEVLNSATKEIELLNQKLDALKDQKKGLMQQLLTGKKRLKF